ncbi:MAG: ATP-binding protein [Acidobacteriota bacterium]
MSNNRPYGLEYPTQTGGFRWFSAGALLIDVDGHITDVNQEMVELLAMPLGQILGRSITSLLRKVLEAEEYEKVRSWRKNPCNIQNYRVSIYNGSGIRVPLEITVNVSSSRIILVAEPEVKSLPTQGSLANAVLEQVPWPAIVIDGSGKINVVNQAAEQILRASSASYEGRSVNVLDKHLPALSSLLFTTMFEGTNYRGITINSPERHGKKSSYLVDTKQLLDNTGAPIGAVAIMQSTMTFIDWQKKHNKRERISLISSVVEETVHKVRNPLTTIKGFLQLYKNRPDDLPWELLDDEIVNIELAIKDIQMLSQNYLGQTYHVNINEIITDLYPSIELMAQQFNIWIELYLDKRLATIRANEDKLKVLLTNLVSNALNAMPNGGVLTIKTLSGRGSTTLQVADSGMGISNDLMDNIFEPFFSTNKGSSGLGLTICEQIVESLNGNIQIKSKEKEGTVVNIVLPNN